MTPTKAMTDTVTFHDPHDGILGAAVPLPGPVKKVADELDGKTLPLGDAVARIKDAAPGGIVTVSRDAVLLRVKGDGVRYLGHVWCVIRFR